MSTQRRSQEDKRHLGKCWQGYGRKVHKQSYRGFGHNWRNYQYKKRFIIVTKLQQEDVRKNTLQGLLALQILICARFKFARRTKNQASVF